MFSILLLSRLIGGETALIGVELLGAVTVLLGTGVDTFGFKLLGTGGVSLGAGVDTFGVAFITCSCRVAYFPSAKSSNLVVISIIRVLTSVASSISLSMSLAGHFVKI